MEGMAVTRDAGSYEHSKEARNKRKAGTSEQEERPLLPSRPDDALRAVFAQGG